LDPEYFFVAYLVRAQLYRRLKRYADAISDYTNAIVINPNSDAPLKLRNSAAIL
jgi:tetratricopeptide (TPR) repeat protein